MSDWSKKFAKRVSDLGKKILHPNAEESTEESDAASDGTTTSATSDSSPTTKSTMTETQKPREKSNDIGKQQIGKVYAQAIIAAAGTTAEADALLAELGALVNDVFAKAPGLENLLASPRISPDEKVGLIDRTLSSHLSPSLLKSLKVVCRHGRLDCLRAIYDEACALQNDRKGIVEIEFVTADPADVSLIEKVKAALSAKMDADIDLRTATDPSLIGGVKVRVGDKVLDASIRQKLQLIREQAVTTAAQNIRQNSTRFEG